MRRREMTTITLMDRTMTNVIGEPEILWPPEQGVPDVLHVATKVFVYCQSETVKPTYREAFSIGITNFDFKQRRHG